MPASPMAFVLSHIYSNIPEEILNAAFNPTKEHSTLDELIIDDVVATRVLMDLNMISGLRAKIPLSDAWRIPVAALPFTILAGSNYDCAYYKIPSTARQGRNIVAIEQLSNDYSFTSMTNAIGSGFDGTSGNTIQGLAQVAIASRTQYNQPLIPETTLLAANIVKVFPDLYSNVLVMECTLEFDRELTNMAQNMIVPVRNLSLCAVKAHIYNKLRIKIDSSEVVAGMTIGAIKEIILQYETENAQYDELLMKARGATLMTPDHLSAFVSMML